MEKIEENKIICHIVGLNIYQKEKFKEVCENLKMYNLIDLDSLNDEILSTDEMSNMFKTYNKHKKNKNDKYKEIDKKMNKFWEENLIKKVFDSITAKKKSILIGKNHHYRILSKRVDFLVSNKFIIDSDIKNEVRNTIKANLENYKNEIIRGTFPLQFLDYKLQMKKRMAYQDSYIKTGYHKFSLDKIIDILKATSKLKIKEKGLWYTSNESYKIGSDIHSNNKQIVAFIDPVLSLLSSFNLDDNNIEFSKDEDKVLSIKNIDANKMKKSKYLYFISKENFMPFDGKSDLKYFTQNSVRVLEKEKIDNVYSKLKELKIMN